MNTINSGMATFGGSADISLVSIGAFQIRNLSGVLWMLWSVASQAVDSDIHKMLLVFLRTWGPRTISAVLRERG